jgi:hypothetical protein
MPTPSASARRRGFDAINLMEIRMITLDDCIGLCGLTEEEVLAIAEHEHLPEIAATALAQYFIGREHGSEKVRDMIVDDIRHAEAFGDKAHTLTLLHVLHHFLKSHPEARQHIIDLTRWVFLRVSVGRDLDKGSSLATSHPRSKELCHYPVLALPCGRLQKQANAAPQIPQPSPRCSLPHRGRDRDHGMVTGLRN